MTQRRRERSLDQQPRKSQMDFYVSFHNLMFQFSGKKISFYRQRKKEKFNSTLDVDDDDNDDDEEVKKVSSCFFLFPHGVLFKKQLGKFLFCSFQLVDVEKS